MKRPRFLCVLLFALFVLAACTGGEPEGTDEDEPAIVETDPDVEEQPIEGEAVPDIFAMEPGDCFNRYDLERTDPDLPSELTTLVDCRRPHDAEIYDFLEHPAGPDVPFPGTEGMEEWAELACYDRFEEFVGQIYEQSVLYIGTIRPPEENWDLGPYRGVHCYVFATEGKLSGRMGGGQL